MRHPAALMVLSSLFIAAAGSAQQFPTLERGFAPNKYFSFGGIDSINTFNGNLTMQIPLEPAYPVSGGFSYRLTLAYNSKVWDNEQISNQVLVVPNRDSNAGMGWTLTLGQVASPGDSSNPVGFDHLWNYMSPDGNRHTLSRGPHPNSLSTSLSGNVTKVDYSRSGEYLRMLTRSNGTAEVDSPDGIARSFTSSTGLATSVSDAFGNSIFMSPQSGVAGTPCPSSDVAAWTITDGNANHHYVCFQSSQYPESAFNSQMVERVILQMPGGSTGTYQFTYLPLNITRGCGSQVSGASNPIPNVPMLTNLTLPDGSRYAFGYNQNPVNGCEQGTLATMTLPTEATYTYVYREYTIPKAKCSTRALVDFSDVVGVGSKKITGPNLTQASWTYASTLLPSTKFVQCVPNSSAIYLFAPSDEMIVTVTNPNGDVMEHYYSVWPGQDDAGGNDIYTQNGDGSFTLYRSGQSENGMLMAEFGMPFTRRLQKNGRFLSNRQYTAAGYATGTSLRSEYVTYELDTTSCLALDSTCLGSNARLSGSETVYEDDANRTADTTLTDFDGLGHYRQTVTGGSFSSGNVRTSNTSYNLGTDANGNRGSAFAFASGDKWVLGTFGDQSVNENGHTAKVENCFDPTGFLKQKRILLGDASSAAGIGESANDVFIAYSNDGHGNVSREQYFGGDTCGAASLLSSCAATSCAPTGGSICDTVSPSAVATYELRHTYPTGVLATSQYYQCDGTPVSFKSVDRTNDPTGVVTSERDTAGNQTTYSYDSSGRVTSLNPPGETPISYLYSPAALAGATFTPATVQALRGTIEADYQYDALGRLWRVKHTMPDASIALQETVYDTLGRKQTVSGFETLLPGPEFAFHPAHHTQFFYDSFDRPTAIQAPDLETTTYGYTGVSQTNETVNVATGASETAVTTTKNFDRQGRLVSVTEGTGTNGAVTTSYGYDVGNRLSSVSMPGTGGTQSRLFAYDGRGFLTSEQHPELGSIGYGTATHSEYDARGHAHRTITGAGFDVRTAFDSAERPASVTDVTLNRTLKQFAYDSGFACGMGTACQGKLAAAARFNYDPDLGTIAVTESMQYGGAGGRPSRRDRSVGGTGTFSGENFFFSQTYDALGELQTLTYPCRSTGGTCNPADRTPPTVNNSYTNGFLTRVAPSSGTAWANSITYQPTGLVSTIQHGGGVIETWAADLNGMARPLSISATDVSGTNVWSTGTYSFDGAGNIKQIGASSYVYDVFNRLASWTSGPLTGSYSWAGNGYDTFGNKVSSLFGACGVDGIGNQFCDGQAFPPVAILGTTNHYVAYTYDAAGNVLSDGKRTFAYDPLNMMTRAQVSGRDFRYLYSADDERIGAVERVSGRNRTTWTVRDFDNQLLSEWSDDWTSGSEVTTWREDEIRRGGSLLANLSSASGTRHYLLDHLGSPRQIADTGGHMIGSQDFTPFGSGGTSNGGAVQFTAHERDAANLGDGTCSLPDYMHARYYDTAIGRFLSGDRVIDTDASSNLPQKWNLYAYVGNNPLKYLDPDGRDWLAAWLLGESYRNVSTWDTIFNRDTITDINRGRQEFIEDHERLTHGLSPVPTSKAGIAMAVLLSPAGEWAGGTLVRVGEGLTGYGFRSFRAFKAAMGVAGKEQEWHHIVEQTAGNVEKFGPEAVHNTVNLVKIGEKEHRAISAYYSSKRAFTGGLSVRQWLATQSFQKQYEFGLLILKRGGL